MEDQYVKDEDIKRCPYCDRPYLRITNAKNQVAVAITHAVRCKITFNEDMQIKMRLREGTLK